MITEDPKAATRNRVHWRSKAAIVRRPRVRSAPPRSDIATFNSNPIISDADKAIDRFICLP